MRKIKKFENFNNDPNRNDIVGLLSDFQSSKFKRNISKKYTGNIPNKEFVGNMTHDIDLVKNDTRYRPTYEFIKNLYDIGHGIKSIIKDNNLPITYPVLRKLMMDVMGISLRKYSDVTDALRKKRSNKVKSEHEGGTGWFSDTVVRRNNNRGIQGYYFNKSRNKYVWLRSAYEYIYALWLDENNIIWDIEYKSFRLIDGSLYKPDFFIFDKDDNIKEIIEVKGYWKEMSYKFTLLQKQLENDGIECKMISDSDILNYTNEKEKNITKIWKAIRLTELK